MAERFDFHGAWRQLVVRACSDPALKAKLLADPAGVLKANGLTVPAGLTVKVVENTDKVVHLVLPVKGTPAELSDAELSDAELQQVAGGVDYNTFWKQVQDGNRPNPNG
jgi:hypothetical protein